MKDICTALKTLSEKGCLPMFISTSSMVAQTPIYYSHPVDGDISDVNSRLKVIENSINTIMESTNAIGDTSNWPRAISDVNSRLKVIEDSINTVMESTNARSDTSNCPLVSDNKDENAHVHNEKTGTTSHVHDTKNTWARIADERTDVNMDNDSKDTDASGWNSVFHKKSNRTSPNGSWRQRLNSIRGTAKSNGDGETFAADVHLVVYGVAKNITAIQLSQFLAGKGLNLLSCDLLTNYHGARSISYKIAIKSSDFEKAQDADIWPHGVGVRLFKFFNPQKERNNEGKMLFNRRQQGSIRHDNNQGATRGNPRTATLENNHQPQQMTQNQLNPHIRRDLQSPATHLLINNIPQNGMRPPIQNNFISRPIHAPSIGGVTQRFPFQNQRYNGAEQF